MKPHVSKYLKHFGYGQEDFIPCEVCSSRAVDVHHIEARGMGGSKKANDIENLMALCRRCHEQHGDKKHDMDFLRVIHSERLATAKD